MKNITLIFALTMVCSIASAGPVDVSTHNKVLTVLLSVKNSAATVRREASTAKWPKAVKDSLNLFYAELVEKSDNLSESYKQMIGNRKLAKAAASELKDSLISLQSANNDMVNYFHTNYHNYGSGSAAELPAVILDLVFDGVPKLINLIRNIKQTAVHDRRCEVDAHRIPVTFYGIKITDRNLETCSDASNKSDEMDPNFSKEKAPTPQKQKSDTSGSKKG